MNLSKFILSRKMLVKLRKFKVREMINKYYSKPIALFFGFALISVSGGAQAGSVEELKHEISFLAKKLLDKSGQDTITVKQPAIQKPFLGVCPEPGPNGLKLDCITPGHNAAKAGLQTGDLVLSINGLSMKNSGSDKHAHKSAYHQVFSSLETGKELTLVLLRGSQEMTIKVTVGAISHPAYTMTISKDEVKE